MATIFALRDAPAPFGLAPLAIHTFTGCESVPVPGGVIRCYLQGVWAVGHPGRVEGKALGHRPGTWHEVDEGCTAPRVLIAHRMLSYGGTVDDDAEPLDTPAHVAR